tara:strand:- start:1566 stop:1823 length:258 start_codon:yes stop_codon:yes gene_type:complete
MTADKIANPTKATVALAERFEADLSLLPIASTVATRRTRNVVEVSSDHIRSIDTVLAVRRVGASVSRVERSNGSRMPTTILVFVF